MGEPYLPDPVRLIAGILAASPALLAEAREVLATEFGPIEVASEPSQWTESVYYAAEMGAQIWRQFLAFMPPIDPGALATIKRRTNELETRWRHTTGRRVNVDPGYLSATKLVLASTKDAAHRIFLGDGIYAEATLRYADGAWRPYSYTYRDYASAVAVAFFTDVRARWLAQRRGRDRTGASATTAPPGAAPTRPPRPAAPR